MPFGERFAPKGNRPAARFPKTPTRYDANKGKIVPTTTDGGHTVKLTFDGVNAIDRQIVYIGTRTKQPLRDLRYWTKRFGLIAFPVQVIGDGKYVEVDGRAVLVENTDNAEVTAYEVKGPLQELVAFCGLPFVLEYHDCIGINLPRLASPNPTHGPRLPVSEKEELRRATAVQLSKPDAELAKLKVSIASNVASEPLSAAVLASFVPTCPKHKANVKGDAVPNNGHDAYVPPVETESVKAKIEDDGTPIDFAPITPVVGVDSAVKGASNWHNDAILASLSPAQQAAIRFAVESAHAGM